MEGKVFQNLEIALRALRVRDGTTALMYACFNKLESVALALVEKEAGLELQKK